jgi:hypothetical protein
MLRGFSCLKLTLAAIGGIKDLWWNSRSARYKYYLNYLLKMKNLKLEIMQEI